ncbi:MAG TPA: hypothetical protein VIM03_04865, partial [Thermoleophilaceae bacterium]
NTSTTQDTNTNTIDQNQKAPSQQPQQTDKQQQKTTPSGSQGQKNNQKTTPAPSGGGTPSAPVPQTTTP